MKINLKNVKNALNRDEMRAVSGGCAGTEDCKSCSVNSECGQGGVCAINIPHCKQKDKRCL